jgi:hypothetical protein
MLPHALTEVREAQVPLLSAMLLGGCAAKAARVLRVGSVDAGLGPTALFPLRLRRPVAVALCAAELACGIALIVTAGGLGRGGPATAARLVTALLFLVATCALIELRTSHPEVGCGCFGDLSTSPVSGRTLARSALFAVAALATIGLPPLRAPHPGADAARLLAIFAVELVLVAALSPEVGEALVRLGYSEPCELRRLPAVRTLAALRRSSQWRRRAGLITAEVPVDMWRELCWRYVVFPACYGSRDAEIVFAVYLRPHRPMIHAALVDSASGEVLPWPAAPARRTVWSRLVAAGPAAAASAVGAFAGRLRPGPEAGPGTGPGAASGSPRRADVRAGSDLRAGPLPRPGSGSDLGSGSANAFGRVSVPAGPRPPTADGPHAPPGGLPFSSDL